MRSVPVLAILSWLVLPLALPAQEDDSKALLEAVDAGRLRDHVAWLAADRLEGRLGGSEGEAEAARYLAARFEEYGLEPGGDEGGYVQEFPLVDVAVVRRARLAVGSRRLEAERDFAAVLAAAPGKVDAEAVEAGPDADLAGRVALVGLGDDGDPAELALAAQERGAVAVLLVRTGKGPVAARGVLSPEEHAVLDVLAGLLRFARKHLVRVLGTFKLGALDPRVLLLAQPQLVEALSGDEAGDRVAAGSWAARREIRVPVAAVRAGAVSAGDRVRLDLELDRERIVSRNVVAILPATEDPESARYLTIGAHFDHVGSTEPPEGVLARLAAREDYVWNGADDNASGTAAILEMARLLAGSDRPRRRTLVFVAFGSEEYGLVGSAHHVLHPAIPLERAIGMLNLDMVGRNPGDPVLVAGVASAPGLAGIVERARALEPVETKVDDQYIDRSDQASFLERKIPVLFLSTGEHPDYHEASDELESLSIDRVARVTRLGLAILSIWEREPEPPAFDEAFRKKPGR